MSVRFDATPVLRRYLHIRGLALFATFALTPMAAHAQLTEPGPGADDARQPIVTVDVQPRVERAMQAQGHAPVFILFREDTLAIEERRDAVTAALGGELELAHRYQNIPAIAGELSAAGLELIRTNTAIAAVQLDGTGSGGLAEAVPAVGVDKVHSVRGLTGKGITVAILDSGTTTRHPALQGAVVAQHCFTRFGCPPVGSSEGESAEDDHNHGSNVSGIVASRGGGGVSEGFAPGVDLVAVKVLNSQNAGQVSDWVAGFDWVISNREQLNITVINASLVSDAEYGDAAACDRGETAMAAVVKKLFDAGVTITASSGNTGHTETMTSPACNTGVIAVGATYDSNLGRQPEGGPSYRALGGSRWPDCSDDPTDAKTLACFTSTAGMRLDVLAPGTQITSTGRGTGTSMFRGTSQAAPAVAGLSALLLECNPSLTPTQVLDILKMTGEPVMDPHSGLTYPLIRGMEAAAAACPDGAMSMAGAGAGAGAGAAGAAGANSGGQAEAGAGAQSGSTAPSSTASLAGSGAGAAATSGGSSGSTGGLAGTSNLPGAAGSLPGTTASVAGAGSAGTTGQLTSAQTVSPSLAEPRQLPSNDAGCSCSAPGARSAPNARHAHLSGQLGMSAAGLALAGWALRRRKRPAR